MSEVRVELGFQGGGSTSITADGAQWEQLQAAFKGDGGWVTITTKDDTQLIVDTGRIQFARVAVLSRAIGFGT